MDVDVKDVEKKQSVKSELKKLQFLGAGPKAVVPDISDSGNGGDNDDWLLKTKTVCSKRRKLTIGNQTDNDDSVWVSDFYNESGTGTGTGTGTNTGTGTGTNTGTSAVSGYW